MGRAEMASAQTPLTNIGVELRDTNGNVIQTKQTAPDGSYQFAASLSASYFVNVAVARGEVSAPMKTRAVVGSPSYYDFYLRNVPATISVGTSHSTNVPGSLVLITTYSYTGATPPTIDLKLVPRPLWRGPRPSDRRERSAIQVVPYGIYYIKCWTPVPCPNGLE